MRADQKAAPQGKTALHEKTAPHGRRVQLDGASPSPGAGLAAGGAEAVSRGADFAAGGAEGVSRGAGLAAGGACRFFYALILARRAAMRASVPSSVGR